MPTVTMIGGGQLARMTHQAAIPLGQCLRVLAASPADPAAMVSADVVLGSHESIDDLRRAARGATALTFDHEGVPLELLRTLEEEGVQVRPPSRALHYAQDKLAMRQRLAELGLPVPAFADLAGPDRETARTRLGDFGDTHGWSVVLKAVRGGFVHVPWLPGQGTPAMALDDMVRGIAVALRCALTTQADIARGAGALH